MRKVTSNEELIHLVDEYAFDHPGQKIKIPAFGKYIRSKGFPVEDHTIRRYKDCTAYINSINAKTSEDAENELVTYKTIDADEFLDANKTRSALKKALIERDSYYLRIAYNAVNAINEKKSLEKECSDKDAMIAELEGKIKKLKSKVTDCKNLEETNKVLKRILDDYVYPDIANIILEKEGVFKKQNTIISRTGTVSEDKIALISASTVINDESEEIHEAPVKTSEFDSINRMTTGFGNR